MNAPSLRRLRACVLSAVLAGTGGALTALPVPAQAAPVLTGVAAPDFASDVHADPWDFSNPEDVLLDEGPTMALESPGVAGGLLSFSMSRPGYLSPVWGGYPGALYLGREAGNPQVRLDAGRYTRFSLHAFASQPVSAGLMWFTCEGLDPACMGGQPFELQAGWNTYDLEIRNSGYGLPKAWSGAITGLRLALSPATRTDLRIDWMRAYAPDPALGVAAGAQWDVDDDAADNRADAPGWGPVPRGDLSALPAGEYTLSEGGRQLGPVTLRRPARPVVLDPDAVGGAEHAAADPWDMNGPQDVAELGNATALGFGDRLTARNAGPTVNDPYTWLRLRGPAIDPNRFHRLTVRSGYEGRFDLTGNAGGGTMGRVVWRTADAPQRVQQTGDIVTYSGTRSVTVDLAGDVHETDPAAGPVRPWGAAPVTGLRWDPNEDPGNRLWWLERVALRADDEAGSSFDIRWYDAGYAPGSTVTLHRQDDATGTGRRPIATGIVQRSGTNVHRWDTGGVPAGTYWIAVEVTGPAGSATTVSSGPVRVVGGFAGQAPSPATPLVRDLAAACPQTRVPEDGFADLPPGGVHESSVDCLAWWGITRPVGGYAPAGQVTRGQMASFLRRVVEQSGGRLPDGPDAFRDDAGNTHEAAINALAQAGLVGGFGDGSYRPQVPVSREQMATFLVRVAEHRSGGPLTEAADYFRDDASSAHQGSINKAAAAGVAGGTAEERYSPVPSVRRDQMGTFLVRLLDLLVSGGHGVAPAR